MVFISMVLLLCFRFTPHVTLNFLSSKQMPFADCVMDLNAEERETGNLLCYSSIHWHLLTVIEKARYIYKYI